MFKGIVAKQQAQAEAASNIKGVSFETFLNALDAADARIADYDQATTLENARNLRTALEQFGGTPDGYRALMAFADADGSLASAFGVKSGPALESLTDTDVMMDVQTLTTGLESYIDGEETPSTEGIREMLRRNKTAIATLAAVAAATAGIVTGRPVSGTTAAAGAAVVLGAGMFVADKIANKGRVEGSVAETEEMLGRVRASMNIVRIAADAVYAQDLSRMSEAADGVAGKIKGDLEKIGLKIEDNKKGIPKIKVADKAAYRGPGMKMVPFKESGWTAEKLQAIASETSKLGVEVGTVCTAVDKKLMDSYRDETTPIPAAVSFIYDALDNASSEAACSLRYVRRSVLSARKFFTTKKEGEDTKPAEGEEGTKE